MGGWKDVLTHLSRVKEATLAELATALGVSKGAAWVVAERCRLFSNLRKVRVGREVVYEITPQGRALVRSKFKRPQK